MPCHVISISVTASQLRADAEIVSLECKCTSGSFCVVSSASWLSACLSHTRTRTHTYTHTYTRAHAHAHIHVHTHTHRANKQLRRREASASDRQIQTQDSNYNTWKVVTNSGKFGEHEIWRNSQKCLSFHLQVLNFAKIGMHKLVQLATWQLINILLVSRSFGVLVIGRQIAKFKPSPTFATIRYSATYVT